MGVYDVNGDGLNDVVTSLEAHGWGLAWYEQKRDTSGAISFTEHMIADDLSAKNPGNVAFSEAHASTFADVDGDGIPDFIVGKRLHAHLESYTDPDPFGPACLVLVPDGAQSQSSGRRGIQAGVDSQPLGRGIDGACGGSEQGRRDGHRDRPPTAERSSSGANPPQSHPMRNDPNLMS